jgi:hypothetical protein
MGLLFPLTEPEQFPAVSPSIYQRGRSPCDRGSPSHVRDHIGKNERTETGYVPGPSHGSKSDFPATVKVP